MSTPCYTYRELTTLNSDRDTWSKFVLFCGTFFLSFVLGTCQGFSAPQEPTAWKTLFTSPLQADWIRAQDASLDPSNREALVAKPGRGVLISTLRGREKSRNLISRERFGDLEVHVEFLLAENSNAGVKLHGLYEIQLRDSHGIQKPTAQDCGGIYPRAEKKPRYHTIDEGIPPRINAAKPAGQWQTLDVVFHAPRFDSKLRKQANARFVRVNLNSQLIHKDVELRWPTGSAWRKEKEVPHGPLYLQGDHGPVAYRNVRVRETSPDEPSAERWEAGEKKE